MDLIDIFAIQQQWTSRRPEHHAFWKCIHIIFYHPDHLGILLHDEVREETLFTAAYPELTPLIISQSEGVLVDFENVTINPLALRGMELDEAGNIRVPGAMRSVAAVRRTLLRWERLERDLEHQAWLAYLSRRCMTGVTVSDGWSLLELGSDHVWLTC